MLFILLLALSGALVEATTAPVSSTLLPQPHVSDNQMLIDAGYFRDGWYWGGAPKIVGQEEWYSCVTVCSPGNCASDVRTNATAAAAPFCWYWLTKESATNIQGSGSCQCTSKSRSGKYCQAYYCDQSVDVTTVYCGDRRRCTSTTSNFGKYKTCTCDTPGVKGDYCQAWTCLGFGDGPTKTAQWKCNVPFSQTSAAEGLSVSKDFCWFFQSDQTSTTIIEAKDCDCNMDGGGYCSSWHCSQKDVTKWWWWGPLVGSLVSAVCQLWVPFFVYNKDDAASRVCVILFWLIPTFLITVLVGGVVSLVANGGALILTFVGILVYHKCFYPSAPVRTYHPKPSIEMPPASAPQAPIEIRPNVSAPPPPPPYYN